MDPLLGTYIVPLPFFAVDRSTDPNDYLEVARVLSVKGIDVAVTRGGGLFVRDHSQYDDPDSRQTLARLLNLVLTEMAFEGLASEPVTTVDIQSGRLIDRHIGIPGGWGEHPLRKWGPHWLLAAVPRDLSDTYPGQGTATYWPPNSFWMPHDPTILDRIEGMRASLVLDNLSPSLPTLLVAAVYHASRHNLAETTLASWIVAEQILSFLWDEHVRAIPSPPRQKRLNDSRTYTAAVRAEILHSVGVLDGSAYHLLNSARKVRNEVAHRSEVGERAASVCTEAMRIMLKRIGISTDRLPGYPNSFGRSGQPRIALDPTFPFR